MKIDEGLLKQGQLLAKMDETSLLEVIGFQLLAIDPPSRAVGVNGSVSTAASLGDLTSASSVEGTEGLLPSSLRALSDVLSDNKDRARKFLANALPKIQAVACDGTELRLSVRARMDGGELAVKVVAEIIAEGLGIPPLFGSLTVTIAAWVCVYGISNLCAKATGVSS